MDDEYEDEYAPLTDDDYPAPFFEQDGPGLFDDEIPASIEPGVEQDGPGLFDEEPEVVETITTAPGRNEPAPPPLALYRRYRPDSFAEVIGQDHVTVPLMRALDNNRVNHAYLFSGPRGCGKTTSARILARCLNCEQGPTSTPCGTCRSCQDLARGGPGSIDVIEIDAASHGGVDDARDLRERAFFAPVHSRYKIYIVDEAHMVTAAGFNALLKLVEEPPPHAKFVFATTEPEKVIGTIRSRTHHYPFRLVPPRVLSDYLTQICAAEGVAVAPSAMPLVVRAGAGSVRDSLSVLDQLLGGAGPEGVEHEQAAALLGFTPDALLDEIMDAFAAGDAAGVFRCIDKVIEVGQDPRRFAEDLLRRLRDLVILAAVPQAADNGMLDVSRDQAQRLATQVAGMGSGELTRAAEVIADGLTAMRGTTAPRLHLELMCSRVLLPGADHDQRGLYARMDRLERRVGMIGDGANSAPSSQPPVASHMQTTHVPDLVTGPQQVPGQQLAQPAASQPAPTAAAAPRQQPPSPQPTQSTQPVQPAQPTQPTQPVQPAQPTQDAPRRRPAGAPPAGMPTPRPQPGQDGSQRRVASRPVASLTTAELRQVWPNVLDEVKSRRRYAHLLLSTKTQVLDVVDGQLLLGFSDVGARENYAANGISDLLTDAIIEVIGVELRIQAVMSGDDQATPPQPRPQVSPPPASSAPTQPSQPRQQQPVAEAPAATQPSEPAASPTSPPPEPAAASRPQAVTTTAPRPRPEASRENTKWETEPEIADDDEALEDAQAVAASLLMRELGAEVLNEEQG